MTEWRRSIFCSDRQYIYLKDSYAFGLAMFQNMITHIIQLRVSYEILGGKNEGKIPRGASIIEPGTPFYQWRSPCCRNFAVLSYVIYPWDIWNHLRIDRAIEEIVKPSYCFKTHQKHQVKNTGVGIIHCFLVLYKNFAYLSSRPQWVAIWSSASTVSKLKDIFILRQNYARSLFEEIIWCLSGRLRAGISLAPSMLGMTSPWEFRASSSLVRAQFARWYIWFLLV